MATLRYDVDVDTRRAEARIGAFALDMRQRITQAVRSLPEIELTADSSDAQRELAQVRADLVALGRQRIGVDIDADDAQARLVELNGRLEALRNSGDVQVDADVSAALAALRLVDEQVDRLDGRNVDLDTGRAAASLAALAIAARFTGDQVSRIGGAGIGAGAGLLSTLRPLALIGAAGGAVNVLAGVGSALASLAPAALVLPGALLSAGAAVATLKVGFAGFGDAMKAADPKAFAEATKNMAPAARDTAVAFRSLKDQFVGVQQAVQTQLFAGVATEVKALGGQYLPILKTGLSGIAGELNKVGLGLATALRAPDTAANVSTILDNTRQALQGMGPALGNVAQGFLQLGAFGTSYLTSIGSGLTGLTQRFRDWIAQGVESGRFEAAIAKAGIVFGQLGEVARNVGSIIGNIFTGLSSGRDSSVFLDNMVQITGALREFFDQASTAGQLGALGDALSSISGSMTGLLETALGPLGAAVGQLAPVVATFADALTGALGPVIAQVLPVIAELASVLLSALAPVLPIIGDAITNVVTALAPLISALSSALAPVLAVVAQAFAGIVSALAPVIAALTPVVAILADGLMQILGVLAPVIQQIADLLGQFLVGAISALAPVLSTIIGAVGSLLAAFAPLLPVLVSVATQLISAFLPVLPILANLFVTLVNAILPIIPPLVQLVSGIAPILVSLITALMPIVGALGDAFVSLVTALMPLLPSLLQLAVALLPALTTLLPIIAQILTAVVVPIIQLFAAALAGVITVLVNVIAGVANFVTAILGFFNNFGTNITAIWNAVWGGITSVVTTVWNAVSSFLAGAFAAFVGFFQGVWNGIVAFFTGIWNAISSVATTVWNAIAGYFVALFNAHRDLWMGIWNGILGFFQTVWNAISSVATTVWNAISGFLTGAFAVFTGFFSAVWNGITAIFTTVWNAISSVATTVWNAISSFFTGAFNFYRDLFTTVWNSIAAVFSTVWNGISTAATTIWGGIRGFFEGAFNAFAGFFSGIWNGIVASFESIFGRIRGIAESIWNGVRDVFRGGVNIAIDAINWLSDKLNVVLKFFLIPAIPAIPRLESGGVLGADQVALMASGGPLDFGRVGSGFVTDGPRAIVGEGRAAHPEYVIPTDPQYRSRALDLYSDLGAQLLAEGGTLGRSGPLSGSAGGNVVGSASGAIKLSDPLTWLADGAISLANGIVDGLTSIIPPGMFRDIASGVGHKIVGAMKALVDKTAATQAATAGGDTAVPSGPIVDVVRATAAQFGWGAGPQWDALGWIISHESGWNPNAQNPTSTAYGLFQFLDGTWASTGIGKTSNPSLQALAGMRYIGNRYHDPIGAKAFWQSHGWYDEGGLAVGSGIMLKQTLRPERVLSPDQTELFENFLANPAARGSGSALTELVASLRAAALQPAGAQRQPVTVDSAQVAVEVGKLRSEMQALGDAVRSARPITVNGVDDPVAAAQLVKLSLRYA